MIEYKDKYLEESQHLEEIINLLKYKLELESNNLEEQKVDLIASRREMWENTTHSYTDYDKLSDLNQYLSALQAQTFTYTELAKRILKYEKMLENPYFSRIDFRLSEDGTIYFIEINPLPGLAPGYSDYPMLAELCGMDYQNLVVNVLNSALKRYGINEVVLNRGGLK